MLIRNSLVALGVLQLFAVAAPARSEPRITLNASEEPDAKQWTLPASLSYISNEDQRDSWAVDVAGRIEGQIGDLPHTTFGRAVVQRNTQTKKEVERYVAEGGGFFEFVFPKNALPADMTYVGTDVSIGLEHKTVFPDQKTNCTTVPLPAECTEQQETSLRAKMALQAFTNNFERVQAFTDSTHTQVTTPPLTYLFLPVVTLFYDDLLDAKRDSTGFKPEGHVAGANVVLSGAFAPRFSDYRLIISVKAQFTQAFERSDGRVGFQRESWLTKVSADYELGNRSFFQDSSGWIPAIGVSYTKGDDPLTGQLNQDNVTFGFKVTYKAAPKN